MKVLIELSDASVHNTPAPKDFKYRVRRSARAIIFNNDKIALIHAKNGDYHKLPGGGVEQGETLHQAAKRETLEEIGCTIDVQDEVGISIEQRMQHDIVQISYCYTAKLLEQTDSKLIHNEYEKNWNFKLIWVTLDEAIKLVETDKPDNYLGKFVIQRDLAFLKEVKLLIK